MQNRIHVYVQENIAVKFASYTTTKPGFKVRHLFYLIGILWSCAFHALAKSFAQATFTKDFETRGWKAL